MVEGRWPLVMTNLKESKPLHPTSSSKVLPVMTKSNLFSCASSIAEEADLLSPPSYCEGRPEDHILWWNFIITISAHGFPGRSEWLIHFIWSIYCSQGLVVQPSEPWFEIHKDNPNDPEDINTNCHWSESLISLHFSFFFFVCCFYANPGFLFCFGDN